MKANKFFFNARHARASEAPMETSAEDISEAQQVTPSAIRLPFEATMPSLGGETAWLNSPPLSAADLLPTLTRRILTAWRQYGGNVYLGILIISIVIAATLVFILRLQFYRLAQL